MLLSKELPKQERYEIMRLLAEAAERLAASRGYSDIRSAIRAYEDLHRAFPGRFPVERLHWKTAWLNWKKGDLEKADIAAQTILHNYADKPEAKDATLLHARFLIMNNRFMAARNVLLRYFALGRGITDAEEAEGLAWLSLVDAAEGKEDKALHTFRKIAERHPGILESDPVLYAGYIRLLYRHGETAAASEHIQSFLSKYSDSDEAPRIRLIQADLMAERGDNRTAETLYGVLADRYSQLSIGKKAEMRRLMLKHENEPKPGSTERTLKAIERIAAENQLSDVEHEARYYLAKLHEQLGKADDEHLERSIMYYAMVAHDKARFSQEAKEAGTRALREYLKRLLRDRQWIKALLVWDHYFVLHGGGTVKEALEIAQLHFRLLDYQGAERLLDGLLSRDVGTVWRQRIALEKMRIWVERGDPDAMGKIKRWLRENPDTIYEKEIKVLIASLWMKQGEPGKALHILGSIQPEEVGAALMREYWFTLARGYHASQRWREAAGAWRKLAEMSEGDEQWRFRYHQAEALLQAGEYRTAWDVMQGIPEQHRDDAWRYMHAVISAETGDKRSAKEELHALVSGEKPGDYRLRAKLLLARLRMMEMKEGL